MVTDYVLRSIQAHSFARAVRPSLLAGIADHESGLNPAADNPSSTAQGLFQMIRATAEAVETGSYAKIQAQDVETQCRTAAKLYAQLRAHFGTDSGAIGAWWVGQSGYERLLTGETLYYNDQPPITFERVAEYVRDIERRAQKFAYLDSAPIA